MLTDIKDRYKWTKVGICKFCKTEEYNKPQVRLLYRKAERLMCANCCAECE